MKKLILILFLLPFLTFGQSINFQNNKVEITNIGKLNVDSTIQTGTSANTYVTIDATNSLIMNGGSTVWDDLTASGINFASGASAPSIRQINSQGVFAACYNYQTANDISYISLQMEHTYNDGSYVHPHIHYYIETDGISTDTAYFKVTTNWTNIEDTINSTNTTVKYYKIALGGKKANFHYLHELDSLNGTGKTLSSQFNVTIERVQSTTAIDTYNGWFCILDYDIHFERKYLGSKTEYSH